MTSAPSSIRYEVGDGIARLTLSRPEKRNALDSTMIAALDDAFARADDDAAVQVVTVAGEGKDFCAGADLEAMYRSFDASVAENLEDVDGLAQLFLRIRSLRKPVVALVQGRALAGGCGLASACDLVFASENARFGYPEIHLGFVPAMVMAMLRRNVSEKRAFEVITLGEVFTAQKAAEWGLVNRVFEDASFGEESQRLVATLAEKDGSALLLTKRLLYHQDGSSFEAAIQAGAIVNVLARKTEAARSGVARFLDRARER